MRGKAWREVDLGDVVEFLDYKRRPLNSTERAGRQGPYPYYGASGPFDSVDDYLFDGRYLLVAEDGENLNSRKVPVAFFATGKFWVNNHAHIIRGLGGQADDEFLKHWFAGNNIAGYITGAAQPKLSQASMKRIRLLLPDYESQCRIASILSAYDDLIENNTRRIAILEEMARRIYEEWFVRFRFPGFEAVRMVESELGLVPEGWQLRALGALVDDVRDAVAPDSVAQDTPYVGLEHLPRRSIALAEWGRAADVGSTKLRFREGDILFGKIRPYFHKVAVAPVAGVASSDAIVIRLKAGSDFGLALAVVSSDAFVAHATQTSNGTKMPRANWGVLREYPVPTPPRALHARFEEFMAGVVSAVANHTLRNRNLRSTRDLLLPKLISGELDVSAMPEPEALAA